MNNTINNLKSKYLKSGQVTVPLMVVVSAICVWCSGLSVAVFTSHGEISGLASTVEDIKHDTDGLPDVKAQVKWIAERQGYIETKKSEEASSTTAIR